MQALAWDKSSDWATWYRGVQAIKSLEHWIWNLELWQSEVLSLSDVQTGWMRLIHRYFQSSKRSSHPREGETHPRSSGASLSTAMNWGSLGPQLTTVCPSNPTASQSDPKSLVLFWSHKTLCQRGRDWGGTRVKEGKSGFPLPTLPRLGVSTPGLQLPTASSALRFGFFLSGWGGGKVEGCFLRQVSPYSLS